MREELRHRGVKIKDRLRLWSSLWEVCTRQGLFARPTNTNTRKDASDVTYRGVT